MNTLIISGGSIDHDLALKILNRKFDRIIGVDGGLKYCYEHQVIPTHMVGDFDTLDPDILRWYQKHTRIEIRKYNPVKDATDTQIALELALELGSRSITLLGGTGTRLDHVLGNIQSMYLPFCRGVACELVDAHNRVRLLGRGCFHLKREEQYGTYFSLIPLTTEAAGITLEGVKYPLNRYCFTVLGSGSLGVSNEILEEEARITIESGVMILIESRD